LCKSIIVRFSVTTPSKTILRSMTLSVQLRPSTVFLLLLLSGVLLGLAWHFSPFFAALGFVPLFYVENTYIAQLSQLRTKRFWQYSLVALLTWNLTAYYWLYYVGFAPFLFAVIANSLLMSIPLWAYHYVKETTQNKYGYLPFIVFWIVFEFLHTQDWGGSWTWLNLGNSLGLAPTFAQWYEYTGVFGGSLWLLLLNVLLFKTITANSQKIKWISAFLAALLVPISISLVLKNSYEEQGIAKEIVVVQPNFDTYTQKFEYNARTMTLNNDTYVPFEKQLTTFLDLTKQQVSPQTALVIYPETSLHEDIDELAEENNGHLYRLREFRQQYPQLTFLVGADSYLFYSFPKPPTPTARLNSPNLYYDMFNSAIFIDRQNKAQFYHKSRLVIGVESNPLRGVLNFIRDNVMKNMGNLVGDLGWQNERVAFQNDSLRAAPVICYESIYGEFVTEYVKKGANLLCIITNDGWWDDSPAPRQHLAYASLRAIETRRSVARAANTGISAFIDQTGEVVSKLGYGVQGSLIGVVQLNNSMTFYVQYGDYIARLACMLSVIIVVMTLWKKIKK